MSKSEAEQFRDELAEKWPDHFVCIEVSYVAGPGMNASRSYQGGVGTGNITMLHAPTLPELRDKVNAAMGVE